jgi:hypothetical protein
MEIACWRLTVRTAIPLGPDVWKPYMEITCSGRTTVQTIVPHRPDSTLKQERFSAKILEILSHSCPSRRLMSTVRTASVHIIAVAHLNPQPINRGPWALRTARIRYWIPQELRDLFVKLLELICSLSSHCKCAVAALQLKSILGVGPKVKDSIEDPFR